MELHYEMAWGIWFYHKSIEGQFVNDYTSEYIFVFLSVRCTVSATSVSGTANLIQWFGCQSSNKSFAGPLFTKREDVLSPNFAKNKIGCFNASALPVKFQSDWSLNSDSRLRDFTRSCATTSVRLVIRGPGVVMPITNLWSGAQGAHY